MNDDIWLKLQRRCVDFYLAHTDRINNWDLVDLSCYSLLGEWLLDKDRTLLYDQTYCFPKTLQPMFLIPELPQRNLFSPLQEHPQQSLVQDHPQHSLLQEDQLRCMICSRKRLAGC